MYDKFYGLACQICLPDPLAAQAQRGIGNQAAQLLLVQGAVSLQDLQIHVAPEFIRAEPEPVPEPEPAVAEAKPKRKAKSKRTPKAKPRKSKTRARPARKRG